MDYFVDVIMDFANYKSRARRKEFWMFHLWYLIVGVVVGVATTLTLGQKNADFVSAVFNLGMFFPSLAVTVRRMHDVNKSGWWMFVPIYGQYLAFVAGDEGDNRFGPDPKAPLDVAHLSKAS
ncbi:DUF805 domain-containing protein [Bdellovibrio sp. NC01]|uniref:DUF805 domain-containing protein n=1 Tax=Bdellovibrio sp. NC01 TaxID=2220073 RepID=UPI00143DEBC8|nr:DUF805 domain-containing protein [Bdellovibrio sp. NC01]